MLLNTRKVLYLFDLDGTLVGEDHWYGFYRNTKSLFTSPVYINPSEKNVRWSILTGRPRIDYLLIKLACNLRNLNPEMIYTQSTWFYKNKNQEEVYQWKCDFIKTLFLINRDILEKIYYVDADMDCVKYLNQNKENCDFYALTLYNFLKEDFQSFL